MQKTELYWPVYKAFFTVIERLFYSSQDSYFVKMLKMFVVLFDLLCFTAL